MKIKTDKLKTPIKLEGGDAPVIDGKVVKMRRKEISSYIDTAREHLEALKQEIYATIDSDRSISAEIFRVEPAQSDVNYSTKPSVFLEKAYTLQTYDDEGQAQENREQPYIKAGERFSAYCSSHQLTQDRILFNNMGKMIGAINSSLSQLNKVQASINQEDYDMAGGLLPVVNGAVQAVLDVAEQSKIAEVVPHQGRFMKALSALAEWMAAIGNMFSSKSKTEVYKEKFSALRDQYDPETAHEELDSGKFAPQKPR